MSATPNRVAAFLRPSVTAAHGWRILMGKPEPDPEVDYDTDYHWDGVERLPGEPRREKREMPSDGLDLATLKENTNK